MRLRLDLAPSERRGLERVAREEWKSWSLSESVHGDIGQGFRADALIIETAQTSTRIGCLAIELPHHGEAFRLQVDAEGKESGEQASHSRPSSAEVFHALDVGKTPQLFLVWRSYEYPDEGLASTRGMIVSCADALLIKGPHRQLLVQVSRVPTWLTLTIDDESVEKVLAAAQEVELLA